MNIGRVYVDTGVPSLMDMGRVCTGTRVRAWSLLDAILICRA